MTIASAGMMLVALVGFVNLCLILPIAVVQMVDFYERLGMNDGLQLHRLATATFVMGMSVFLSWRLLIWLDQVFWAGGVLGPTAARWKLDLVVGLVILSMTSVLVVAFWKERRSGRGHRRGIDTATLIALAMRGG